MTFEEYLPYAELQLSPEKNTRLRALYNQKKYKEFNFLLLERCIKYDHIKYDNVLELMEQSSKKLEKLNTTVDGLPRFIEEAKEAVSCWKNKVLPLPSSTYFGDNTDTATVLTHMVDSLRNAIIEMVNLEGQYRVGARLRISTFAKDGAEYSEYFGNDEDITKTIMNVLGRELEKTLNIGKDSGRGKE